MVKAEVLRNEQREFDVDPEIAHGGTRWLRLFESPADATGLTEVAPAVRGA